MPIVDVTSEGFKRNPIPTLIRLAEAGDIVETRAPLIGRMKVVTTYDDVMALIKDQQHFATDARNAGKSGPAGMFWLPKSFAILAENMLTRDDPDHRRLRKLVDQAFRSASIDALRPRVEIYADQLIDRMEREGEVDLVRGYARLLPLGVICDLLGLPEADRPMLMNWMDSLTAGASLGGLARIFPMIRRLSAYFREEFEKRREAPGDGLITALVQAEAEGDRLSQDELLAMVWLLFVAGHETTTHLISTSVLTLLESADAREQFMAADPSGAARAVDELLRRESPVQTTKPRFVREDIEFRGVALRRGQMVIPLLASANMDARVFPEPERLDFDRSPNRHVGFGGGPHLCLGLQLARMEAAVALKALFARWPDIAVTTPAYTLAWTKRFGMRGLAAFPVRHGRAVRRTAA